MIFRSVPAKNHRIVHPAKGSGRRHAMAKIKGIEGMQPDQINFELQRGAKFVIYTYCVSILVMTFKRGSPVHFVRSGESAVTKGLPYSLISLLLGWWGIPWGPIWTV